METNKLSKANLITIKAVVIAVLTLLMLIPISMVRSLVEERENVKQSVKNNVDAKWGGHQHITGPILVLPFSDSSSLKYAYFLPKTINIKGDIKAEQQADGMYKIPCYQSNLKIDGYFDKPDFEKLGLRLEQIKWDQTFIIIGIPYLQGIKNQIDFNWNGNKQEILSSVASNNVVSSGLTIKTPIEATGINNGYEFDFSLLLNGSDSLTFAPVGKETHIEIRTAWKNATYVGEFLPSDQNHTESGFEAKWSILDYNRNYPQMWIGDNTGLQKSTVGIDLQTPIDQYRQAMRSIKYAVMIIALTFVVFFLSEILSKDKRIHPIQYLLVSFGLVLFYCLLLSISEYTTFAFAYFISAMAIVILITLYSYTFFKKWGQTILLGFFLSILYMYLYVILQAENTSLLLGSIGLFIALASIMYVTRKVNWYKNDVSKKNHLPKEGYSDNTLNM